MPDAFIISNSSCLIALESIGQLELLQKIYRAILIPEAVRKEFGSNLPGWIHIERVQDKRLVRALLLDLGPGEAEVIVLGLEQTPCTLILDDKKGRRFAGELGLTLTGTVGVLLKAKQQGYLPDVRHMLEVLEQKNFRVSAALKARALQLAGE